MSTHEQRERTRLKVRRWRQKHADDERLRRAGTLRTGVGGRQPTFTVCEWTDATGVPVAVFVCRLPLPAVPDGLRIGNWLPCGLPLPRQLARALRDARLAQIQRWCCGGDWPGASNPPV